MLAVCDVAKHACFGEVEALSAHQMRISLGPPGLRCGNTLQRCLDFGVVPRPACSCRDHSLTRSRSLREGSAAIVCGASRSDRLALDGLATECRPRAPHAGHAASLSVRSFAVDDLRFYEERSEVAEQDSLRLAVSPSAVGSLLA